MKRMLYSIDEIIKYCTVRLRSNDEREQVLGSGVLLRQDTELENRKRKEDVEKIYLLTVAHCVEEEGTIIGSVRAEIYNPSTETYQKITIENLETKSVVLKEAEQEIVAIAIDPKEILAIAPNLPSIPILQHHASCKNYHCAGFPNGNMYEYDHTNAQWEGGEADQHRLTYQTDCTYTEIKAIGFSGGGIFAVMNGEVLLEGLMTKYRFKESGNKLIGCDFQKLNEQLYDAHLPLVHISYVVAEGVTEKTIRETLKKTYENLGQRFIPASHVDITVEEKLETVCRTPKFYQSLQETVNKWLNEEPYIHGEKGEAYQALIDLRGDVIKYMRGIKQYDVIDFTPYKERAKAILSQLEAEDAGLMQAIRDDKISKQTVAQQREELFRLERHCNNWISISSSTNVWLANKNFVIIHGEAGCGKSHLLGHFSQEVSNHKQEKSYIQDCPAILLLGGNISMDKTIEKNILSQLDTECSFEELLTGLEAIGQCLSCRVPIMIDALNETKGMSDWQDKLPGFVKEIASHKYISLIVTIRDTYIDDVLTETSKKNWERILFEHVGFAEEEYKAVQSFCTYYELNSLKMPILNPEFSNPLYLHIACQIAKDANMVTLPTGWQVYDLFDKYASKLDKDFAKKNPDLYKNRQVVTKAIAVIVKKMCEIGKPYMAFDDYDALLHEAFPSFPALANELIDSSLLSKGLGYLQGEDVYFTYQRMGDYYIAKSLIESCESQEDVKARLAKYAPTLLDKMLFQGVMEQLFVMVPERFNVEIWDVLDVSNETRKTEWLLNSLHWRSADHIHQKAIIDFLIKNHCGAKRWYRTVLYLAPIPNHPFNGDYWHWLWKEHYKSMASRDAALQYFILDTTQYISENNICRLIDWAWTPGISREVDEEVARLVGKTLAWFLSSTIHAIRNNTTKALVNLLQHQPRALFSILQDFQGVDDTYIQERLMAVTYGCVLRCEEKEAVCALADLVYKTIFAGGNPPRHILLRDYACNIVDYAHRMCGFEDVNMQLVLPPYGAQVPELPEKEDVDKLMIEDNSDKNAWAQNAIIRSLYGGLSDFGDKIVDYSVTHFAPWSFTMEEELKKLLKRSRKGKHQLLKIFVEASVSKMRFERNNRISEESKKLYIGMHESIVDIAREGLTSVMQEDELKRLEEVLIPNRMLVGASLYRNGRNPMPYRYWIVQRVFELGYDRNKHGAYDSVVQRWETPSYHQDYLEGRKERIGKKYQWIAYYELLGCMADNYYIANPWNTSQYMPYDGAWEELLRDIDPVCITKRDEDVTVDTWIEYEKREEWNDSSKKWMTDAWTIDDVRKVLMRKDDTGKEWFTIHDDRTIHAPKQLGKNPYHNQSFYNFYVLAYLIRKEDKERVIALAGEDNFLRREMAWPVDGSLRYVAREKYWSRACKVDECETSQIWKKLHHKTNIKVIVPYVGMRGTSDEDCKLTDASYYMPIQPLFEGMGMAYADVDGEFTTHGELSATCNPNAPRHFLIRRDVLMPYLESQGWDIIWIMNQERFFSPDGMTFMDSEMWQHSGLFYLDEQGELQGKFKIQNRDER